MALVLFANSTCGAQTSLPMSLPSFLPPQLYVQVHGLQCALAIIMLRHSMNIKRLAASPNLASLPRRWQSSDLDLLFITSVPVDNYVDLVGNYAMNQCIKSSQHSPVCMPLKLVLSPSEKTSTHSKKFDLPRDDIFLVRTTPPLFYNYLSQTMTNLSNQGPYQYLSHLSLSGEYLDMLALFSIFCDCVQS